MQNDDPKLQWRGATMMDRTGQKIGRIDEIYVDVQTGAPEWALVHTGLFGTSSSFVPLAQASHTGDDVTVPYDKDMVKDAPRMDDERQLSPEEEGQLYRHYDMQAPAMGAGMDTDMDTGTMGHDTSGPTTDDAMTRSEEEMHVGTQTRETGRARLRKHIETEQVTESVPVSRQHAEVVREPITDATRGDAMDGPEMSEEEHEVVLTEEVPVVEKQTVPKERVRLETSETTDEVRIDEDLQHEVIEVDENVDTRH